MLTAGQLIILSGLLFSFRAGHGWRLERAWWHTLSLQSGVKREAMTRGLWPYAILLLVFLAVLFPFFSARFNLANRVEMKSVSERKTQLLEAKEIFWQNKILGVGPGAYTLALYEIFPTRPAFGSISRRIIFTR